MSKKQPKISLHEVENDLSHVMDALNGTPAKSKLRNESQPQSDQEEPAPSGSEVGKPPSRNSSSKKSTRATPPQAKPPTSDDGGALTSEQLDWLFTSSPRENGTTQVRVSKRTKEAVYLLAQHHGGIPGGQLFDNIVTYFLTNNIKELKKITRRDPLNQF